MTNIKNSFMVVRHSYDDHSYIDGKNDTCLTKNGIEIAKEAAIRILPYITNKNVIIRHSTKRRGLETAEIFAEYILKKGSDCQCIGDIGLTELYQGKFDFGDMKHEDRVNFLQSCWDDFELCRTNGILNHNFGINKDKNVIINPGENHLEWSRRIADGLLNIISDVEDSYQSINIAHRGVIYEIEQLVRLSNGIIDFQDVEKYQTRWMNYCQEYTLELNDLSMAKKKIKEYKNLRS